EVGMNKPLAISMGEPAGVGPDILLDLYARQEELLLPPFCVFGHIDFLRARANRLGLDIQFTERNPEEALTTFSQALPVVHVDGLVPDQPGKTSPLSGGVVIAAIEQATAATLSGYCRALVTAPIHKGAL